MKPLNVPDNQAPYEAQDGAWANQFFIVVLWGLFLFSLGLAPWHGTWMAAFAVGLPVAVVSTLLLVSAPASLLTRMMVGASLMAFAGLHIHQANGMIEMHFGVFVLLALLVIYEDWRVIVVAAGVIAVHHLATAYLQSAGYGVMCMPTPSLGLVLLHAGYVVVESAALGYLAASMHKKTLQAATSLGATEENLQLMQTMASQTRSGVDAIRAASQELTQSAGSIAEGAKAQASSLEDTAASLEQMTTTMRQTAENAIQANQLASSSKASAEQGQRVVTKAVDAMQEINLASAKISDIISTIDEIAFQTNLLAVNAAVEAARAGEQGRGFAVVAAEVRSLAQRSAAAAKEIKRLIEDTLKKVARGTELVNRSGETLQTIVASTKRVTDIVGDISAAAAEQSVGIEQVNKAVIQIDQVTQLNSAQTDELSATARALSDQSIRLAQLVETFRTANSVRPEQSITGPGSDRVAGGRTPILPRHVTPARGAIARVSIGFHSCGVALQGSGPVTAIESSDCLDGR